MSDAIEQKSADHSLVEKARLAEQLASAADAAPGAMYLYRLSGDGRESIPYASANWERLFGVALPEVRRDVRPIFARIHFEDLDRVRAGIAESARTLTSWRAEFRYDHPTKGYVWLEARSTPVVDLNGDVTWHGYVQDVTERRETAARMQKLHADRLNAMGQTASGLAHQINQPLSATAAYLEAARRLLQKKPELNDAEFEEILSRAAAEIMRVGRMIDQLRRSSVGGEPDKTFQNLHDLIEDACGLAADRMQADGIRLNLRLNAESDQVLVDRAQIQHAVANLIRNAIEAMHASRTRELTISTSMICRDMIQVDVADTGVGLPEPFALDLFEPWMTTKANRSGVGLTISRSIVEAHYGTVWAESNLDGGAVFRFTLPLADGEGVS